MTANPVTGARSRAFTIYLTLGAAAIATYYFLPRAGVAQGILLTVLNATAAVAAFRAARKTVGSARRVWIALGASMALATLANGPYYAYPLITGRATPFPCPVDLFWLLTYPCFVVALMALSRQRRREERRGNTLDSMLIIVAGATLMWVFVIAPIVNTAGIPLLTVAVSAAYPVMDLCVFAMLVRLVVATSRGTGALRLLLASFVALLIADLVYSIQLGAGSYKFGGVTDGLWMASYLLIGLAALHPAARAFPRPESAPQHRVTKGRLAFLSVSALAGPVVMTQRAGQAVFLAGVSAISFLLVMARITGLNRRLTSVSQELATRASTDALTGLANRSHLYASIGEVCASDDIRGCLLLIDLDDFKSVNDTAGHSTGDAVLIEVAARIRSVCRDTDVVARLGGDEFAILVTDSGGVQLAQRLIDVLTKPFVFAGREFMIGASTGVAPVGAGMSPDRLVQNADFALYEAKRMGKGCVAVFDDSMYAEIVDRSNVSKELLRSIATGDIGVEYQPIIDLETGRTVGLEALARWKHDRLGEVPPLQFIPIAEESGAIVGLGRLMLRSALAGLARVDKISAARLKLNVNVSVRQLLMPGFCDDVVNALANARILPGRLTLEITETAMIEEGSSALNLLHELRAVGVQISIDDFGTGYSSLAYLGRLPVQELKIDRAFVDAIDRGPSEAAVTRAIARIAETLGLRCVAEGVERMEQIGPLRAAGCRFAQGFYFAQPMTIDDMCTYLSDEALLEVRPHESRSLALSARSEVRA